MLIHLAGTEVQDIFYTLPNTGDAKDYKRAVDVLNAYYFVPKVDTTYARHCFRQLTQELGKQLDSLQPDLGERQRFVITEQTRTIKSAMKSSASATVTYIKRKLLEEGQGLTLDKALEIAENCEKVHPQLAAMTTKGQGAIGKEEDTASINRIEETKRGPGKNSQLTCHRCGKTGHVGKTQISQQEASLVVNVGWKDTSKSVARRSINVIEGTGKPSFTGIPNQALQTW